MQTSLDVRRAIAQSDLGVRSLARLYGVSPTTVAKWKRRRSFEDAKRGPKTAGFRVLSEGEERMIDTFRRYTMLPIDDCLYVLQTQIPHLTRATLHRCFQRHKLGSITALSSSEKSAELGSFFLGVSSVRVRDADAHLAFAIDQATRVIYAEVLDDLNRVSMRAFLRRLQSAIPYPVRTIVTSGGPCLEEGVIDSGLMHRHVEPYHLWALGPVASDTAPVGHAAVTRATFAAETREFVARYNDKRRLKALRGLTPMQNLQALWRRRPEFFLREPRALDDSARAVAGLRKG